MLMFFVIFYYLFDLNCNLNVRRSLMHMIMLISWLFTDFVPTQDSRDDPFNNLEKDNDDTFAIKKGTIICIYLDITR